MNTKKWSCLFAGAVMILALSACGSSKTQQPAAEPSAQPSEISAAEWTREGRFRDEKENMVSITWMEDTDEPGWYVGCMLGEDAIEGSWGGTLPQEGSSLHGTLQSSESEGELTVTISEDGEDGILLSVEGGDTYHLTSMGDMTASIIVTINTEGWGMIGYEAGEKAPELDPEWPYQSAQINLGEPETYTFAAAPETGSLFVKWTKNGEDFSTEPVITVSLDESADFIAVFEEDPGWQNPVMNFIGEYQSGRAHARVECLGKDEARITIDWGDGAAELARWDIQGRMDTETLTIEYTGAGKSILTYDENGEIVSQEPEYEAGTGTVTFHDDGTFTWHEEEPENREDMVFAWVPVTEG